MWSILCCLAACNFLKRRPLETLGKGSYMGSIYSLQGSSFHVRSFDAILANMGTVWSSIVTNIMVPCRFKT